MGGGLTLQLRSKSILCYWKRREKSKFRTQERQKSIENLLDYATKVDGKETYTGLVTHGSQKRLTKSLENLLQVAQWKTAHCKKFGEYRFRVNFITLTLYSFNRKVPGREAHKTCLEPLLRWLRSKGMTSYVWKAELQSKRKDCHQLHYHLTTDVYIDYKELRQYWNALQRKAGYLDYFYEKFGHWNPNSTDVHATHNKKNLIGYLKKKIIRYADKKKYQQLRNNYLIRGEMAKKNQNKETIEGKVWDCSQNLKVSFWEIEAYGDITSKLAQAVKDKEVTVKEFERCTVYEITNSSNQAYNYVPYPHRIFYHDHIDKMRNYERLKPDINTFSSS